jgi:aspartyl-tRNA(Asn)/glutamyl-tRNA(Gln) amidotransferase subunit A
VTPTGAVPGSLTELTAHELAERFASGAATAVQATEAALERIAATDERLHAFLTVTGDQALKAAGQVDAARERGEPLGPLAGVPLALKDVLVTKGVRTTAGSKILEEFVPPYDATVVRRVRDAATLLETIAGHDPMDSTSIPDAPVDVTSGLTDGVDGLRVGMVKELFLEGTEPGVLARVREGLERLERLGARLEECSLPSFEYALSAYYLIAPAECSSNLARYDGVRWGLRAKDSADVVDMMQRTREAGFGAEVKRRVMLGTYALSAGYYDAYYGQAQKVRTLVRRELDDAYRRFDLLVGPTAPTVAFKIGEKADDPLAMYLNDVFTIPVNLAGNAAVSVPAGLSDGLPVGLQLIAPALGEATMLRAAWAFEQDLGLPTRPQEVRS